MANAKTHKKTKQRPTRPVNKEVLIRRLRHAVSPLSQEEAGIFCLGILFTFDNINDKNFFDNVLFETSRSIPKPILNDPYELHKWGKTKRYWISQAREKFGNVVDFETERRKRVRKEEGREPMSLDESSTDEHGDVTTRGTPRQRRPKGTAGGAVQFNGTIPEELRDRFRAAVNAAPHLNQSTALEQALEDFLEKVEAESPRAAHS